MKRKFTNVFVMIFTLLCAVLLITVSCDNGTTGDDSPKEYGGEYVNIINSYWDGTVNYGGYKNSVIIGIPDDSNYVFYLNGVKDDTGTYSRNFNTATLVSDDVRYKGKTVGVAIITDPDTVHISLNSNSQYPGASGTVNRRK